MKESLESKLKDKVALVTGASRGVGRAIVERLSNYSMKIGLLARSEEKLRRVQESVSASGSEAMILCADLRNQKEIERAVGEFREKYGTLDLLINNAGIGVRGFWQDIGLEKELEIAEVNYIAPLILIRLLLPEMIKANRGHIININTIGAIYTAPFQGAYCASKAALLAYTTSLSYELEKTKVHITSILPGPIDTEFLDQPNFEGFKNRKEIVNSEIIVDKVLAVIDNPKETVFIGSFLRILAVKIAGLNPRFFGKIIETQNIPPKK